MKGNLPIISLHGVGNIEKHFFKFMGFDKEMFENEVKNIAKVLAEENFRILLLPDKGLSLEIAKKYKEFGGKEVIGCVPFDDNVFGIGHLKPFLQDSIFDEFINTEYWYKENAVHGLLGDCILLLGLTLGSLWEFSGALYILKLIKKIKKVYFRTTIHEKLRADKYYPFCVIVYKPFMKEGKLPFELEKYIEEICALYYAENSNHLKKILKSHFKN